MNKKVKEYTKKEKLEIIREFLYNKQGIVISFGWNNFSNQMIDDIANKVLVLDDLKVLKVDPTNNSGFFDATTAHPKYLNQILKFYMTSYQQYYIFKEDYNNYYRLLTTDGVSKDKSLDFSAVSADYLKVNIPGEIESRSKVMKSEEVDKSY